MLVSVWGIVLVGFVCCTAFTITLTAESEAAVYRRVVGAPLIFQLGIPKEQLQHSEIDVFDPSTVLCITIDGSLCHCVRGVLPSSSLKTVESCTKPHSHWFGIALSSDTSGHKIMSKPIFIPALDVTSVEAEALLQSITLVHLTCLDDVARSLVSIRSLSLMEPDAVHELIVVVPPSESVLLRPVLIAATATLLFPVRILEDSHFIADTVLQSSSSYSIQMALKLLVSREVHTAFYITLDADCVQLRPLTRNLSSSSTSSSSSFSAISVQSLIVSSPTTRTTSMVMETPHALYENERRSSAHPDWWMASAAFLGYADSQAITELNDVRGFSVTPAILSAYGSRVVVSELERLHGAILYVSSLLRNGLPF